MDWSTPVDYFVHKFSPNNYTLYYKSIYIYAVIEMKSPKTQLGKPVEMYYGKDTAINPFLNQDTRLEVIAVYGALSKLEGEPLFYFEPEERDATHLYHGDEKHEDRVLQLRGGALRLLMLIMFTCSRKGDRIRIFYDRYMERLGVRSKQTFYNCIKELVDRGIIIHYRSNIYWTNPLVFCAGSRHTKYPEKVDVIKKHYLRKKKK